MKKILSLCLLVAFCLGVGRAWYWVIDGFHLARIEGCDEECDRLGRERELSPEAETALSQRYFYLGRGRQCFAFQSEDEKYVIKFPRMDRYKSRLWFRLLSFPYFKKFLDRRLESHIIRKDGLFNSFEISYDYLNEDTAMVAMFKVPKNGRKIEIVDRLGRIFLLPLGSTKFILQRKVRLFKDVFGEALAKKDMIEVEKILDQLLAVIVRIANKGILSKDGSFMKNFGFDGVNAYQIDIGSFYQIRDLSPLEVYNRSIHASVETLRVWLLNLDPALLKLIDRKLNPIYEKGFDG